MTMKPIVEVPGWFATSCGRIYSEKKGAFLNGRKLESGYIQVGTNKGEKVKLFRAHRLICRAFNGDPPTESHTVDHINNDRCDNRPENLRWSTIQENISHSVRQNRRLKKLSPELISQIRTEYEPWNRSKSASVIAKKFNIHRSTVHAIFNRTINKHL
jgi:hypothetical protein